LEAVKEHGGDEETLTLTLTLTLIGGSERAWRG